MSRSAFPVDHSCREVASRRSWKLHVGDDLRRRLDDLPEELEELYWLMMQRIKPAWYLEEGFRLLRMVKVSAGGVSLLRLFFAEIIQSRILALLGQAKFVPEVVPLVCDFMKLAHVAEIATRSPNLLLIRAFRSVVDNL